MGKAKNLITAKFIALSGGVKPDPAVWLFSSTDNRHYNYNSSYLFEYVLENYKDITPLYVINDPVLRGRMADRLGEEFFIETDSAEGIRKALSAGVWFTSAGLPVYGTNLKKDRIIVNLWHGVPLKKIALCDPNLKKTARLYFHRIFSENYTHILTTSEKLVPIMRKSFDVPRSVIKVWGQPRNDVLFQENDKKAILNHIYNDLPDYKRILLYAPTFRDNGSTRIFPFEDYDREKLEQFLEDNKLIIFLRTHIKERENADRYLSDRIRFLGNEEAEDINGILNIFDLLITDYSSIYIDYLLTGRPEIFLPYDKEEYLADRGMNFDYEEFTPGPKPDTMQEFQKEILDAFYGKDSYAVRREELNAFFNEVNKPCSGRICEEIYRTVKEKQGNK